MELLSILFEVTTGHGLAALGAGVAAERAERRALVAAERSGARHVLARLQA